MPKEAKLIEQATKDLTPVRAQNIFENKIIDGLNEFLPDDSKISSTKKLKFQWHLDNQTDDIIFSVVQRTLSNERPEGESTTYVILTDPDTGEKYREEKLNQPASQMEKVTTYILETDDVKKTFNKLDPEVKKTFINGYQESLETGKNLIKKWEQALKKTMREDEQTELNKKIKEEKLGQEETEKMLKALE